MVVVMELAFKEFVDLGLDSEFGTLVIPICHTYLALIQNHCHRLGYPTFVGRRQMNLLSKHL